jgi:hypothetical protein
VVQTVVAQIIAAQIIKAPLTKKREAGWNLFPVFRLFEL